jgi:hypothetical protein
MRVESVEVGDDGRIVHAQDQAFADGVGDGLRLAVELVVRRQQLGHRRRSRQFAGVRRQPAAKPHCAASPSGRVSKSSPWTRPSAMWNFIFHARCMVRALSKSKSCISATPRVESPFVIPIGYPPAVRRPSNSSPPPPSAAAPATSSATPTDIATENQASRRPMVFSITAKVDTQGT